jgi:hypothetical protein
VHAKISLFGGSSEKGKENKVLYDKNNVILNSIFLVLTFLRCSKIHFCSTKPDFLLKIAKIDFSGNKNCNNFSVAASVINAKEKMRCSLPLIS